MDRSEIIPLAKAIEAALFKNYVPIGDSNTANPPTDAQMDSEYGTPSDLSDGTEAFVALHDDNGDDSNVYLVATNGTSWWSVAMTKLT